MKRVCNISVIIAVIAVLCITYNALRNLRIANEQYNAVIAVNDSLILERNAVIADRNRLDSLLKVQHGITKVTSDSLELSLRENKLLRRALAAARDSLLSVSDDSIVVRMDAIRPNMENMPDIYSLAGPQARFWYTAYVDLGQTSALLKSAENSLKLSSEYSASLVKENGLLLTKQEGYVKELALCDAQVQLFRYSYEQSESQIKKMKKYPYISAAVGFTLGVLLGGR